MPGPDDAFHTVVDLKSMLCYQIPLWPGTTLHFGAWQARLFRIWVDEDPMLLFTLWIGPPSRSSRTDSVCCLTAGGGSRTDGKQ